MLARAITASIAVFIVTLLTGLAEHAHACSCTAPNATMVFEGRVRAIRPVSGPQSS